MGKHRITLALVLAVIMSALTVAVAPEASAAEYEFLSLRDTTSTSTGDSDGSGNATITVNRKKERICWTLTWAGLEAPVFATFYKGTPGLTKGPIETLVVDGAGAASDVNGCAKIPGKRVDGILKNPMAHYVGFADAGDNGGALRGHLRGAQSFALLDGAQQEPDVSTSGTGTGFLVADPAKKRACWYLSYGSMNGTVTDGHIHDDDASGDPVVIDLHDAFVSPGFGCKTVDIDVLDAIADDHTHFYFNIHSTAHPSGEIRGDLRPA